MERERSFVNDLTTLLIDNLKAVGPLAMALVPAGLSGYSIYHALHNQWPLTVALIIGLAMAIGMEALGVSSAHNVVHIVQLSVTSTLKRGLLAIAPVFYVLTVAGTIWFVDALPGGEMMRYLGTASPLLALLIYLSRFFSINLADMASQSDEVQALQHELKLEALQRDFDRKQAAKDGNGNLVRMSQDERRRLLGEILERGEEPIVARLAAEWGVSRQTVYADLEFVKSESNFV